MVSNTRILLNTHTHWYQKTEILISDIQMVYKNIDDNIPTLVRTLKYTHVNFYNFKIFDTQIAIAAFKLIRRSLH